MVYCWSCGEERPESPEPCEGCGASHAPRVERLSRALSVCGGCGYAGEGVRYFSRAGHAFLLGLVSLVTYGLGGLVYWALRRNAQICPACGLTWDRANPIPGTRAAVSAPRQDGRPAGTQSRPRLPPGGLIRRVLGIVAVVFSLGLLSMGILDGEAALAIVGSIGGSLGAGAYVWGRNADANRRDALVRSLQAQVLALAHAARGMLTVTDVATDMALTLDASERLLSSMDDSFRVRSDVTRDGVIVYRFPEIIARHRPAAGTETLESMIEGPEARDLLGVGRRSAAS